MSFFSKFSRKRKPKQKPLEKPKEETTWRGGWVQSWRAPIIVEAMFSTLSPPKIYNCMPIFDSYTQDKSSYIHKTIVQFRSLGTEFKETLHYKVDKETLNVTLVTFPEKFRYSKLRIVSIAGVSVDSIFMTNPENT